jgi:hypothetical protein
MEIKNYSQHCVTLIAGFSQFTTALADFIGL